MEDNKIASFIVRISMTNPNKSSNEMWRIKVTYVQQESEQLFQSLEEAVDYMKAVTGVL